MGGLKLDALSALLNAAPVCSAALCLLMGLAGQLVWFVVAKARHNSQVSQLWQCELPELPELACLNAWAGVCMVMAQSAGICTASVVCDWANTTCCAAMSSAITLPAQPRKGRRINIRAIKRQRFKLGMCQ